LEKGKMNLATKRLRVLFVENSDEDFALILEELQRGGYEPVLEKVVTRQAMAEALQKKTWDLILCDHTLPQFNSAEALRLYKESGLEIPFIIVSGTMDEELAAQTMNRGAHDYLSKNNLVRLIPIIQRELRQVELRMEYKSAEESLRASQHEYESLVNAVEGIVWEADPRTFQFSFVSQEAKRLLGYPVEDWLRDPDFWKYHIHPDDRDAAVNFCVASTASRKDHAFEYRMIASDGRFVWLRDSVKVVVENNIPVRLRGIMVDITDLKQAEAAIRENEAQLRQAQKMESVGQLAGGVAHDFNNLLTIIQGHSSLMLSSATLTPNDRESAQQISIAAERAANLTRQLLTFSRRQIIQSRALDLNKVVNNVTQMLRRVLGEDICFETNLAPDVPSIFADDGMIEQILINLAVNSRDAMPKGGHLLVGTSAVKVDAAFRQQNPEATLGEAVCLTVSDTGFGIAAEHLTHIFEPFFTTKGVGKGTGLGLATVYGIVKQHSGWILVESDLNQGTTFQIYFPANKTKKVKLEPLAEPLNPRGGHETILLVEDESPVRHLVKSILLKLGYSILEADSGVAALKVWKHHREKIHLLLTDMVMPDGITGRELAEIVQFDRPEIKVIYTSGYNAEIVGKDFTLHDGLNFLQKPYPPQKLAKAVRDCLDDKIAA
jgi:PAS domain S-box-containing protein